MLYINVDGHQHRQDFMEAQLAGEGAPSVTRLAGAVVKSVAPYTDYTGMALSETGCSLSHLKAARHIVENGLPMALVLEDDVSFALSHRWPCKLSELVPQDPNWTTQQLGYVDIGFNSRELEIKDHLAVPGRPGVSLPKGSLSMVFGMKVRDGEPLESESR